MKKHRFIAVICIMVLLSSAMLFRDKQILSKKIVRLHVVADSDKVEDQQIKLKVRDAVLCCLQEKMKSVKTAENMSQPLDFPPHF